MRIIILTLTILICGVVADISHNEMVKIAIDEAPSVVNMFVENMAIKFNTEIKPKLMTEAKSTINKFEQNISSTIYEYAQPIVIVIIVILSIQIILSIIIIVMIFALCYKLKNKNQDCSSTL